MADGLLTQGLNYIDQQKQALAARLGLLMNNPQEFAAQLGSEARQRAGVGLLGEPKTAQDMASGAWINSPYGQHAMEAGSGFAGTTKLPINNKNFNKWFGESKVLSENNEPLRMYHGTGQDFQEFQKNQRGVHFLTPSPEFANKYAGGEYSVAVGESPNIIPAFVKSVNPFDFENKKHVNAIAVQVGLTPNAIKEVKNGLWSRIEDRTILDGIKKLGFDGVYVKEQGVKNLGVFAPEQIKSVFNRGTFDTKDPRLLYGGGLVGATQVEVPTEKRK
jgi:hypothetical protein